SRSDVFEVVARLVDKGVDIASIKRQVMDLSTENRLRLLGYLLNEKMKVFPDKGAAYIAVSKKELRNFDFKKGDLEGVVNYILRMDGIRFAALLSERQDKIRMSFRSLSPKVDVNKFAAKYWEGGGHVQAAGGTSSFGLELTCMFLEQQIEKCLYDKV
ncbi:MAG: DHHA1 domain-containing protein, partial [Bacteroidales bacterium]|nr:DHHA1 domain-containing protein [Bacteroidales bacterium]